MAVDENTDDETLVTAAVAGNQDAFRLIVQRYGRLVSRIIQRQVGDQALTEEILQETFSRAFFSLSRFRFQARLSTWLSRIALNATHNYFNSRRYRESRKQDQFRTERHEQGVECMEEEYLRKQRLKVYREALAELRPNLREVLVLCALEGKSYEEVAHTLEIPVGTVRSRLNNARLQMKSLIGRDVLRR